MINFAVARLVFKFCMKNYAIIKKYEYVERGERSFNNLKATYFIGSLDGVFIVGIVGRRFAQPITKS